MIKIFHILHDLTLDAPLHPLHPRPSSRDGQILDAAVELETSDALDRQESQNHRLVVND